MIFANWIAGPHFIGVIFILAGLIQKRFPPKEINSLYGYRTTLSMKNQQNWDEGNRYSTTLIIKCGWVLVITGIIITGLLMLVPVSPEARTLTKVILMLLGAFGTVIILFRATEKHLRNTFDQTT
ncbi:MAG: SdpI family protein [Bacteroidota bacterium]